MILGKLPVLGRPTNLENIRPRPTAVALGATGVVWTLFSHQSFSILSPCLGIDMKECK